MKPPMKARALTDADRADFDKLKRGVAARLVAARHALGKTRREWMEQYHVIPSTMSHWETGHCLPDMAVLLKICTDHDLSLDFILLGKRPRIRVRAVSVPIAAIKPKRGGRSSRLQTK